MNTPLNGAGMGGFTSTLMAISEQGILGVQSGKGLQGTEFAELLATQHNTPELLEALRGLLPEAQLVHLESLLTHGNVLPPPAGTDASPGLPLIPLPGMVSSFEGRSSGAAQSRAAAEGEILPALPAEALRQLPVLKSLQSGGSPVPTQPVDAAPPGVGGGHFSSALSSAAAVVTETPVSSPLAPVIGSTHTDSALVVRSALPAAVPELRQPVGAEGWDKALGERILWMVGRSVQSASLRVTPPQLGPVEIQLSMQQEQATVSFNVQHAAVREALEASVPRLREMFLESNLQLVNVDVGQRDNTGQRSATGGYQGRPQGEGSQPGEAEEGLGSERPPVNTYHSDGFLDDYA